MKKGFLLKSQSCANESQGNDCLVYPDEFLSERSFACFDKRNGKLTRSYSRCRADRRASHGKLHRFNELHTIPEVSHGYVCLIPEGLDSSVAPVVSMDRCRQTTLICTVPRLQS